MKPQSLKIGRKNKSMTRRLFFLLIYLVLLPATIFLKTDVSRAFEVKLVKYLFEIKGGPDTPFNQPTDLAIGKHKRIYVLDGVYDRVQVFDGQGNFLFVFGKTGSSDGELNRPVGLDVDRQGNVYVADSRNHRVQVFDPDGHYINKIVLPTEGTQTPPDPVDVLIINPHDEIETLYVTDNDNHRVLAYEKENLKFLFKFGVHGFEEAGSFRYPFSLASDSDYNYIFVVDVLNTRVQMFDRKGNFVRKIGGWGIREGTFFRPKGVTSDADDNIYISDSYMGVIQLFRPDGSYVSVVGTQNNKEEKFKTPVRIYIDQEQRLYVVEELANKVSVYSLL
jgi:DNA-binding beta-propeller fold protein YncE